MGEISFWMVSKSGGEGRKMLKNVLENFSPEYFVDKI